MLKEFINSWVMLGGASVVSAAVSHFFTRRQNRGLADSQELRNLKEVIDIYKEAIQDLKLEQAELKAEMKAMRKDFEYRLEQSKKDYNGK